MSQPSRLLLIDLGAGRNRLGGSLLAQVHRRSGGEPADLDDPQLLRALFAALRELKERGLVLAYHDRSDGGVLVTLLEMAFAGHCGLEHRSWRGGGSVARLFAEELGAVLQVPAATRSPRRSQYWRATAWHALRRDIGEPLAGDVRRGAHGGRWSMPPRA